MHSPEDALEGSSSDASDLEDASNDDFGFVLSSRAKLKTRLHHPPQESIHQLWQIFIDNVDPLTKVVHVPTLRPAMQKAASDTSDIPRSFEALMFSIYSAAVMSLKDNECKQRFGEYRKAILSRYISATKTALLRAKFMGSSSLVTLQALILHLMSVRDIYEPRAIWSLTGVAVRIAQSMGLERDGLTLGLAPFETEIRRRIWWQLKGHDFRTAELCGLAKFRDLDDSADSTKWPMNVNDEQLYRGMLSMPVESSAVTDFVFVALRGELSKFAASRVSRFRQQGKNSSQFHLSAFGEDKIEIDKAFKEIEEAIETKFIRYCDPSVPLQLLTMLIARFSMNIVRFLSHHPRKWASIEQTPLSERQFIWDVSLKLLEQHNMLQSNPQLKKFSWHAPYYQQWHAFIHVLDTLRANPLEADAEKAWTLIRNKYTETPEMISDTRKPIHVFVGNLCLKAYSDREAVLQAANMCLPPTPDFILRLRHQREAAKARRQARDAKSDRPKDLYSQGEAATIPRADQGASYSSNASEGGSVQPNTTSHFRVTTLADGVTEDDPFWTINGFDDSGVGSLDDVMNMDLDSLLAQDNYVDNTSQPITWEQWDAWLTDSNLLPPLSSVGEMEPGS